MVVILSFLSLLLVLIISGFFSNYSKTKQTNKEKLEKYFIAGNSTKPFLLAFATFSTNTSAFMFTGFIGFTYFYGFSAIWLIAGWVIGDLFASLMFYKKILQFTKKYTTLSFPTLVTNLINTSYTKLKFTISVIALIFIGCYAVAQIIGGGKVLATLLGVTEHWGSFLTIAILSFYCAYGGLKASILVNTLQSIMMLFGASIFLATLVCKIGGIEVLLIDLKSIEASFKALVPNYLSQKSNIVFFILGWIFAGIGTIGMPHTLMQVTTLDNVKNLNRMRAYYYFIYSTFSILTFLIGICIRVYKPNLSFMEAENSLIETSKVILNPVFHGFIMASIFASIISTVDSQTVACTSIISQDLVKKENISIYIIRILMVGILLIFFLLSVIIKDTIFLLYRFAWSTMASSFAPLIFLIIFNFRIPQVTAIITVVTGGIISILWYLYDLNSIIHEVFAGMAGSFAVYFLISALVLLYNVGAQGKLFSNKT